MGSKNTGDGDSGERHKPQEQTQPRECRASLESNSTPGNPSTLTRTSMNVESINHTLNLNHNVEGMNLVPKFPNVAIEGQVRLPNSPEVACATTQHGQVAEYTAASLRGNAGDPPHGHERTHREAGESHGKKDVHFNREHPMEFSGPDGKTFTADVRTISTKEGKDGTTTTFKTNDGAVIQQTVDKAGKQTWNMDFTHSKGDGPREWVNGESQKVDKFSYTVDPKSNQRAETVDTAQGDHVERTYKDSKLTDSTTRLHDGSQVHESYENGKIRTRDWKFSADHPQSLNVEGINGPYAVKSTEFHAKFDSNGQATQVNFNNIENGSRITQKLDNGQVAGQTEKFDAKHGLPKQEVRIDGQPVSVDVKERELTRTSHDRPWTEKITDPNGRHFTHVQGSSDCQVSYDDPSKNPTAVIGTDKTYTEAHIKYDEKGIAHVDGLLNDGFPPTRVTQTVSPDGTRDADYRNPNPFRGVVGGPEGMMMKLPDGREGDVTHVHVQGNTTEYTESNGVKTSSQADGNATTVTTNYENPTDPGVRAQQPLTPHEVAKQKLEQALRERDPAAFAAAAEDYWNASPDKSTDGRVDVTLKDANGQDQQYHIEIERLRGGKEAAGGATLVNVYHVDDKGKEESVFLAVRRPNGSTEVQRTKHGPLESCFLNSFEKYAPEKGSDTPRADAPELANLQPNNDWRSPAFAKVAKEINDALPESLRYDPAKAGSKVPPETPPLAFIAAYNLNKDALGNDPNATPDPTSVEIAVRALQSGEKDPGKALLNAMNEVGQSKNLPIDDKAAMAVVAEAKHDQRLMRFGNAQEMLAVHAFVFGTEPKDKSAYEALKESDPILAQQVHQMAIRLAATGSPAEMDQRLKEIDEKFGAAMNAVPPDKRGTPAQTQAAQREALARSMGFESQKPQAGSSSPESPGGTPPEKPAEQPPKSGTQPPPAEQTEKPTAPETESESAGTDISLEAYIPKPGARGFERTGRSAATLDGITQRLQAAALDYKHKADVLKAGGPEAEKIVEQTLTDAQQEKKHLAAQQANVQEIARLLASGKTANDLPEGLLKDLPPDLGKALYNARWDRSGYAYNYQHGYFNEAEQNRLAAIRNEKSAETLATKYLQFYADKQILQDRLISDATSPKAQELLRFKFEMKAAALSILATNPDMVGSKGSSRAVIDAAALQTGYVGTSGALQGDRIVVNAGHDPWNGTGFTGFGADHGGGTSEYDANKVAAETLGTMIEAMGGVPIYVNQDELRRSGKPGSASMSGLANYMKEHKADAYISEHQDDPATTGGTLTLVNGSEPSKTLGALIEQGKSTVAVEPKVGQSGLREQNRGVQSQFSGYRMVLSENFNTAKSDVAKMNNPQEQAKLQLGLALGLSLDLHPRSKAEIAKEKAADAKHPSWQEFWQSHQPAFKSENVHFPRFDKSDIHSLRYPINEPAPSKTSGGKGRRLQAEAQTAPQLEAAALRVADPKQNIPPDVPDRYKGTLDRSQFEREMSNPAVLAHFAGRMNKEVSGQGFAAQVAWAETIFNRAAARGTSIERQLRGAYYPTSSPGSSDNPQLLAAIKTAYYYGSDTTHGATGNGSVGFGPGGHATARIGGEVFGVEAYDADRHHRWREMYPRLKAAGSVASREQSQDSGSSNPPPASEAQKPEPTRPKPEPTSTTPESPGEATPQTPPAPAGRQQTEGMSELITPTQHIASVAEIYRKPTTGEGEIQPSQKRSESTESGVEQTKPFGEPKEVKVNGSTVIYSPNFDPSKPMHVVEFYNGWYSSAEKDATRANLAEYAKTADAQTVIISQKWMDREGGEDLGKHFNPHAALKETLSGVKDLQRSDLKPGDTLGLAPYSAGWSAVQKVMSTPELASKVNQIVLLDSPSAPVQQYVKSHLAQFANGSKTLAAFSGTWRPRDYQNFSDMLNAELKKQGFNPQDVMYDSRQPTADGSIPRKPITFVYTGTNHSDVPSKWAATALAVSTPHTGDPSAKVGTPTPEKGSEVTGPLKSPEAPPTHEKLAFTPTPEQQTEGVHAIKDGDKITGYYVRAGSDAEKNRRYAQEAINAAAKNSGGRVILSDGSYRAGLEVDGKNITIAAEGQKAYIENSANTGIQVHGNSGNIVIDGLNFRNLGTKGTGCHAIEVLTDGHTINSVEVKNCSFDNIRLGQNECLSFEAYNGNINNVKVTNCDIKNIDNIAICCEGTSSGAVNGITISGNRVWDASNAINPTYPRGDNSSACIQLDTNCHNFLIANNMLRNSSQQHAIIIEREMNGQKRGAAGVTDGEIRNNWMNTAVLVDAEANPGGNPKTNPTARNINIHDNIFAIGAQGRNGEILGGPLVEKQGGGGIENVTGDRSNNTVAVRSNQPPAEFLQKQTQPSVVPEKRVESPRIEQPDRTQGLEIDKRMILPINVSGSLQNPAWSPDGKSIAFTRFRNGYNKGPADIYVYNVETKKLTPILTGGRTNVSQPGSTWTKDGSIVFSSDRSGHEEIYAIKGDGSQKTPVQLTSRQGLMGYEPSLSPDGQKVVFESHKIDQEGSGRIVIHALSGNSGYQYITPEGQDCRQPNWSPDGNKIVYQQNTGSGWNIMTYDTKTGERKQIVAGGTDATFSPDGKYILYSKSGGAHDTLYAVPADGGTPQRVIDSSSYNGAASWSPNGRALAMETSKGDPDGTAGTQLAIDVVPESLRGSTPLPMMHQRSQPTPAQPVTSKEVRDMLAVMQMVV